MVRSGQGRLRAGRTAAALAVGASLAFAGAPVAWLGNAGPASAAGPGQAQSAGATSSPALVPAAKLKPARLSVTRTTSSYRYGAAPAKLVIKARTAGKAGTGKAYVRLAGKWRPVKLVKGRAVFAMPGTLKPAKYTMTVKYRKSARYRYAIKHATVRVKPGITGLSVKRSAFTYRQDQVRAKLAIVAQAGGKTGTGTVSVQVAGRTYKLALAQGKATFTMPDGLPAARYPVLVSYRKNPGYALARRTRVITVNPAPGATPRLKGSSNFRDLAGPGTTGYKTADGGHVARGVIFRSNTLVLSPAEVGTFQGLGIKAIYDLRRPSEIKKTPDTTMSGISWTNVDIYANSSSTGGMPGVYKDFVVNPTYRAGFGTVLKEIAAAKAPVDFHCAAGKDRTGWTAALLLSIAGVPRETIMSDYLASNAYLNGSLKPGDKGYGVKVEASWLSTSFSQMTASYGSLNGYLTRGLGMSNAQIEAIREKLVA